MPASSFFSQVARFAGQTSQALNRAYGQADRAVGGFLPGGAESLIGQSKRFAAASAMNQLPDRMNLFSRYVTGVGNTNLKLDPSTLESLRNATRPVKAYSKPIKGEQLFDERGNPVVAGSILIEKAGPTLPTSGPVNPYLNKGVGIDVTQTLGRFTATANPSNNTLRIQDKYDMINNAEDPDLVSGKFQPQKAWNEIEAIWNPVAGMRNFGQNAPTKFQREYNVENVQEGLKDHNLYNRTHSPLTRFARALMYVSPKSNNPYEIDITVPMTGLINQ